MLSSPIMAVLVVVPSGPSVKPSQSRRRAHLLLSLDLLVECPCRWRLESRATGSWLQDSPRAATWH